MVAVTLIKEYRYKGRPCDSDIHHKTYTDAEKQTCSIIVPKWINVAGQNVAQYAPTVYGKSPKYDPAGNCEGNFMAAKFMYDNNCYNYSVNIATNSYAQPGRMSGLFLPKVLDQSVAAQVIQFSKKDGLIHVGGKDISPADLSKLPIAKDPGHFVALMFSDADTDYQWNGDYHWARCENSSGTCDVWSQKDSHDQVTNFDFAGDKITDPRTANWKVNHGKLAENVQVDQIYEYKFIAWMFVPLGKVEII